MHLVDMFELWNLVEDDLLSETISYRLRDTGQGKLNKLLRSPNLIHLRTQPSTTRSENVAQDACNPPSRTVEHRLLVSHIDTFLGQAFRVIFPGSGAQ
jgi:Protein of unknown function (DUF2009)